MELTRTIIKTSYRLLHNHLKTGSFLSKSQTCNTLLGRLSSSSSSSHDDDEDDDDDIDGSDDEEDRFIVQWLKRKEFQEVKLEDYTEYLKTDEDVEKMKWILQQYEMIKYDTGICPTTIEPGRLKDLFGIDREDVLATYFQYLYRREATKATTKMKKEAFRPEKAKILRYHHENDIKLEMGIRFDPDTGKPIYGKWRNSFFMDYSRKHEITRYIPRHVMASQFGQKLVIDLSYDNCMNIPELKNTSKQLTFGYSYLRDCEDPFDLWFCNLHPKSPINDHLIKDFGWSRDTLNSCFIHRTQESYLDLFPRDRLVYLCPDSSEDLTSFDDEDIYIIGGLVDKYTRKPLSLAKCKSENIRAYRLPLDQYFHFRGNKILTIDQVIMILVSLKEGKSMFESLEPAVPIRKLKLPEQIEEERQKRLKKMQRTRYMISKMQRSTFLSK